MSGGGAKKGERRGGRRKGSLNKVDIERALIAERQVEASVAAGKKLAKEVLEEFMHLFAGMAAHHQPLTRTMMPDPNREPNPGMFEKYAKLAIDCADKLAPYQSPTFGQLKVFSAGDPAIPAPKLIEGNVVSINDYEANQRVYKRMIQQVRG